MENRIRQVRKAKKLTQQDIARKLNINQTAISQWERGSTVPKNEKLIQLCEILETSSD